jgi:hypothetical protein
MNICLFIGPTLAPHDADAIADVVCLPPVRQGDVHRAVTLLEPRAIGIVDGYFQSVPSVWHKEILWAIDRGVHVFGAASMGALRAAELHSYGMHGVGVVFEAYRDGRLQAGGDEPFEDDDEVAVVHGPAEAGYPPISEAMVNIRCTLAAAQAQGILSPATRERLARLAKGRFFPERNYEALLQDARTDGIDAQELGRFGSWLPQGRVNQKRVDALAMLESMQRFLATNPPPGRARFHFEATTLWHRGIELAQPSRWHDAGDGALLDELRLRGAPYDTLRDAALAALVPHDAPHDARTLAHCLTRSHGDPDRVEAVLAQAALARRAVNTRDAIDGELVERRMLAHLQGTPLGDELRHRAADKQTRLAARRDLPEAGTLPELQRLQLRDWYFSQVLAGDMPDDLDLRIRAWGYADADHFHETLLREYAYRATLDHDTPQAEPAPPPAEPE